MKKLASLIVATAFMLGTIAYTHMSHASDKSDANKSNTNGVEYTSRDGIVGPVDKKDGVHSVMVRSGLPKGVDYQITVVRKPFVSSKRDSGSALINVQIVCPPGYYATGSGTYKWLDADEGQDEGQFIGLMINPDESRGSDTVSDGIIFWMKFHKIGAVHEAIQKALKSAGLFENYRHSDVTMSIWPIAEKKSHNGNTAKNVRTIKG